MRRFRYILLLLALLLSPQLMFAEEEKHEELNVQEIIFEHMLDSYSWHVTKIGEKDIVIYLPVILYSKTSGWHVFSSRRLHENGGSYEGFYPADQESAHAGKLMEKMADGTMVRPIDLSLTKMALALLINGALVLLLFLPAARWYRKHEDDREAVPGKYVSFVEMIVTLVEDSIVKPCVGKNYRKFSPYLLTAFFFIFTCNLMSLIPFFPGGVGVTANMSITLFLAACTFIAVNVFGSREYWKEIVWPDVPTWLKVPIPIMPFIEFIGIFTKPIALMIRLFANMLGGHMAMLVLTVLIFIGFSAGKVLGGSMTFLSVLFNIFMNALEVLVAFIQAYVFTLLSSVFIGSAQVEHHKKELKTDKE